MQLCSNGFLKSISLICYLFLSLQTFLRMDGICGTGKAEQDHNREYHLACILESFPFPAITR